MHDGEIVRMYYGVLGARSLVICLRNTLTCISIQPNSAGINFANQTGADRVRFIQNVRSRFSRMHLNACGYLEQLLVCTRMDFVLSIPPQKPAYEASLDLEHRGPTMKRHIQFPTNGDDPLAEDSGDTSYYLNA